ncbi:DUF397 domain-containing protein [Streptomyces sp. NPDC090306]|uniref:DUF397 domain-containing protein n=1 Tax=Streptomyces sp. NPDC090306 TaxID=3365961 RepID=UPI0038193E63
MTSEPVNWTKSSYSNNGGACVEVAASLAAAHGVVPVRDSKHTDGPVITLTASAFSAFVAGLTTGRSDTEGVVQ